MDKMQIEGGSALKGNIKISGAKNATLPLMAAALLAPGKSVIRHAPDLRDIRTFSELLDGMDVKVEREGTSLEIDCENVSNPTAPYELVKTMRASVLVLGPLLARCGKAKVSLPGGCAIGARPIDQHLKGLEALGVKVELDHGYVVAEAAKLKGASIVFDTNTVTGTENVMMAAVLAEGETVLENAASEPEIVDLASALTEMGAEIIGAGSDIITIRGVSSLKPFDYEVMPDRIEAGTFMAAAAITRGELLLEGDLESLMHAVSVKFKEAGTSIELEDGGIRIKGNGRARSVDVKTLPYPGFPTDMQAQFMAFMSLAGGLSVISETIFENRFLHVSELKRMGADIQVQGRSAVVRGVDGLEAAPVMASDLRASAALVLAGLAANGVTEISRIYHLDRGYEKIEEKLLNVGAKIKRIK